MENLVRLNYTVNMEYISPSNNVFVSYPQAQLTVLSIRSHTDGQTFFGTRLKRFLLENNFRTIVDHLVPFERIPSDVTHQQLLQDTYDQRHGEGYVIEIIQPDRPSYLVKIKTKKYFVIYGDGGNENSPRSLFEAIINQHTDDLTGLFKDDPEALKRIDEMERNVKPKFNRMVQSIEKFYQANKHLSKKDFTRSITTNEKMKIYLPLLIRLYAGEENDYKGFALKHAKELFGIGSGQHQQTTTINQDNSESDN
jgi:T4 RnlA family RNA ligase